MASINLFTYADKNTFIHRLNPLTKIISFILLNILIFNHNFYIPLFIILFSVMLIIAIQINFLDIIKKSVFILYISLFALIFGSFDYSSEGGFYFIKGGFTSQSLFVMKLLASFLTTEILLNTTKISQINDLITFLLRHIPFLKRLDPGLYISLTIKFIPQIFSEYNKISNALKVRAGNKIRNPIQKSLYIFIPLILNMIRKAITTTYALQIKCSNIDRTIILERFRPSDIILMSIQLLFLIYLWILYLIN